MAHVSQVISKSFDRIPHAAYVAGTVVKQENIVCATADGTADSVNAMGSAVRR